MVLWLNDGVLLNTKGLVRPGPRQNQAKTSHNWPGVQDLHVDMFLLKRWKKELILDS